MAEESIKKQALKGSFWATFDRIGTQLIGFVVIIIMSRLLTPADYGLVGMLLIFIDIATYVVESGFTPALIRKQDRTEVDNCTAFWFNLVAGIVFYFILFFCAPLIARFYNNELLTPLMRIIALSVPINALIVVQKALLTAKIDFKTQAKASMMSAILSGLAGIAMARFGFGVWAIAWYQILILAINTALIWKFANWRPSFLYSWTSFKSFIGFGSKLSISGILHALYRNGFQLIIGKVYNDAALGFYTRAAQFSNLPSLNIANIMQRIFYPIMCKLQDDPQKFATSFRKFVRINAFVTFPLMAGLIAVAYPLISLLLSDKWIFSATLLQIISLGMMLTPLQVVNLNILSVCGRTDLYLRLEVIKKIFGVAVILLTVKHGLVIMCWGQVLYQIFDLACASFYTKRMTTVSVWTQFKDIFPIIALSAIMCLAILFVISFFTTNWIQLLIGVPLGILIFVSGSYLLKLPEFQETKELILHKQTKD